MALTKQPRFIQENPATPYFIEVQRYRQTWIWVLLGALLGTLLFLGAVQFFQYRFSSDSWLSAPALLFMGGIWGLMVLLAYKAHLFLQITGRGIEFQLFPFQWSVCCIEWGEINEMYVRNYDGIAEYGGWGMKYGPQGKSYTISGRHGVQLHLTDDQQILIGTQRPTELEELIMQLRCQYGMRC